MDNPQGTECRDGNYFRSHDGSEARVNAWPPYCCVAAFVAAALERFGHTNIDHKSLARDLGISVPSSSRNPWGLRVEVDPTRQGLTVAAATEQIPAVLAALAPSLSFRHVLFSHITLGLIEDVLGQAIRHGCIVGVGYDVNRLSGMEPSVMRHVARLEMATDCEHVMILDDSRSCPPKRMVVQWADLIPAVNAVSDGFWLVGLHKSLNLAYTL